MSVERGRPDGHGSSHGHGHGINPGAEHEHEHARAGWLARLRHAVRPHSHNHADSLDNALEASEVGIRALKISLAVLMATALAQCVVVWWTGSVALLADTIHNFSDALTAVPLWIAFLWGRRAPTRRFTYGFGRAEDLAGLFVVAMIALSAAVAGWQSIDRLLHPRAIDAPLAVAIAGLIGFVGNEAVAVYRIRIGTRIGSAALVADGHHARTDGFTSLAVLVGAVGVMLGYPLADPIVGLIITAMILVVLRGAARDVLGRLMDAVDPALTDAAVRSAMNTPGVLGLDDLRLRWSGHRLRAEASVLADPDLDLGAAHGLAHEVQHALLHGVPKLVAATVHVGPASAEAHAATAHHPVPSPVPDLPR